MLVNLGGEQLYLFDLTTASNTTQNTNNFKYKHDSFKKMLNEVDIDSNMESATNVNDNNIEIAKK